MEAKATPLLEFIKDNQKNQLVIPIYQRVYSWEKEQCKELWDDIVKAGGDDKIDRFYGVLFQWGSHHLCHAKLI